MASRSLADLHPYVRHLALQFLAKCKQEGINVLIYCTYRSKEEQDALYAQGRTAPGRKVTNARGGYSYHNYGLAFDCVPMIDGRARWDRVDLFNKMGQIGTSLGLIWGGNFKSFKDRPHFQWSNGLTIKQLLAGQRPPNPLEKIHKEEWQKALDILVQKGIINSPEYWLHNDNYKTEYVRLLIQKFANALKEV